MMRKIVCLAAICTGLAVCGKELTGTHAVLKFDDAGRVVSLREKRGDRELLAAPAPFVQVAFKGETGERAATRLTWEGDGRATATFADKPGKLVFEATPFFGGWTFRLSDCTCADVASVRFFALQPVCRTYVGRLANMLSDDASGVCLRGYSIEAQHSVSADALSVTWPLERKCANCAVGLVAAPRDDLQMALQGMTVAAAATTSRCGGAWALGAEENRSSYLIADAAAVDTMDDLLAVAERAGVGTFHFRSWWEQYGWYAVNTNKYPRGLDDLRACSHKAQAAGFRTTMHTLTGCIGPSAPWLAQPVASNLVVCHSYTLAAPIPAAGDVAEIVVNEKPAADHGFDFAMWSRGNTIRIGEELFQYSDISFAPPYKFLNVRRARFGTKPEAHPAQARADYLWCFFGSFLAEPGTPLADALADRVARVYRAGDFAGIYFDGADGYGRWPVPCARILHDLYDACAAAGPAPQCEDSLWTTHGWWHHSRIGSWDYARWSPKTFVDRHVRSTVAQTRKGELLEPALGWWPVVTGSAATFGYMRDDVEYFGAKVAGLDASFSLIPGYARGKPPSYAQHVQLTLLGWYERFRMARAFRPEVRRRFAEPGREFRLAQDEQGAWRVAETHVCDHRMGSPADRAWTVSSPAASTAVLRVRALDGAAPWEKGGTVLSAADASALAVRAAAGAKAALETGDGAYGCTLRLCVANASAPANGAWGCADKTIPRPFLDLNAAAGSSAPLSVGTWVKGDGSGATANFRFRSPACVNNAVSEHYVKLDFTGWRYFAFSLWREHDAGASEAFRWPYAAASGPNYNLYERNVATRTVENVGVWLNGVKPGATAAVEIADLRVLPSHAEKIAGASVVLGGVACPVPFDLTSGEYAELEDGFWTKYALGGEPLRREKATVAPRLAAGDNAVAFVCAAPDARAQVTVTALGAAEPALVAETPAEGRRWLAYEADLPRFFASARNMAALPPVRMRPGEKAKITFTLVGPAVEPVVKIGGETRRIARTLGPNDSVAETLDGVFEGVVDVAVETRDATRTAAQLLVVKRYVAPCDSKRRASASSTAHRDYADWVDTRVGATVPGLGSCMPGPCLPHGSVYPSPDTLWPYAASRGRHVPTSGYHHGDPVVGFSQFHTQGTGGHPSYGIFLVSPSAHPQDMTLLETHPHLFRAILKRRDAASPNASDGIVVRLAPARFGSIYEFTFPSNVAPHLVYDAERKIGNAHGGTNVTLKVENGIVEGGGVYDFNWCPGPYHAYFYGEEERRGQTLVLRLATSMRSPEKARANFAAELRGRTLDELSAAAKAQWNAVLGRVRPEGLDARDARLFYSHLFHAFVQPRDRTGDVADWPVDVPVWDDHYTLWDTWRTVFPLLALLDPATVAGCVNSFAARSAKSGFVGVGFCAGHEYRVGQAGDESDNVMADACAKGVPGIDWEAAWAALARHAARRTSEYLKLGYVPFGVKTDYCWRMKSGSSTLGFAYNDFCAAAVARKLGKTKEADALAARAHNWTNVWDATLVDAESGFKGFCRGRFPDGRFTASIAREGMQNPPGRTYFGDFYEGSCWEYSFAVPGDVAGMIAHMGGRDRFLKRLEYAFAHDLIDYGNEPSFMTPWLFDFVDRPDLATRWARRFRSRFQAREIPGDDDGGAMGAMYVFLTAGLYPIAGQDLYALHAPSVKRLVFVLPSDAQEAAGRRFPKEPCNVNHEPRTFTILSDLPLDGDVQFGSIELDGKPLARPFIRHADLVKGGTLHFKAR